MTRKKAILYIVFIITLITVVIFGFTGILTLREVLTSSTYINAVKKRKEKLKQLDKEYKMIVADIHSMNAVSKNMQKDDAITCSQAINKVSIKKDYYYKEDE